MAARTYTIGVTVDVTIDDDGTVTYDVDRLGAAGEIRRGDYDASAQGTITDEQRAADEAVVEADAQAWLRNAAGDPL